MKFGAQQQCLSVGLVHAAHVNSIPLSHCARSPTLITLANNEQDWQDEDMFNTVDFSKNLYP